MSLLVREDFTDDPAKLLRMEITKHSASCRCVVCDHWDTRIATAIRQAVEAEREACATELSEIADGLRCAAKKIREEWTGPDIPQSDRRANFQDARDHEARAGIYDRAAAAIRARNQGGENG